VLRLGDDPGDCSWGSVRRSLYLVLRERALEPSFSPTACREQPHSFLQRECRASIGLSNRAPLPAPARSRQTGSAEASCVLAVDASSEVAGEASSELGSSASSRASTASAGVGLPVKEP
jgi:hypothetical protein